MRIGTSLLLIAIGAMLTFAITADGTPIDGLAIKWDTIGAILMVIGAIGFIWSLVVRSQNRDAYIAAHRPVAVDDRSAAAEDRVVEERRII